MSRRRWLLLAAAVSVVVVLSAPLWLGYFGPETGAYATLWRPWRSDITVTLDAPADSGDTRVSLTANYRDRWPGQASSPGWQVRVIRMSRPSPLLPWVVTATGTGP